MASMFAARFKELRIAKGYTQEDVANILGVSPSTVGMYEQGKRQPDNDKLVEIANTLDTTVDYLLGNSEFINVEVKNCEFAK